MYDKRAIEIHQLCAAEGLSLPRPIEEIIAIEEAGGAVDLCTGQVLPGAADWTVERTVVGDALAVVLAIEEGVL